MRDDELVRTILGEGFNSDPTIYTTTNATRTPPWPSASVDVLADLARVRAEIDELPRPVLRVEVGIADLADGYAMVRAVLDVPDEDPLAESLPGRPGWTELPARWSAFYKPRENAKHYAMQVVVDSEDRALALANAVHALPQASMDSRLLGMAPVRRAQPE